jgi:hypothetical protein
MRPEAITPRASVVVHPASVSADSIVHVQQPNAAVRVDASS